MRFASRCLLLPVIIVVVEWLNILKEYFLLERVDLSEFVFR